MLKEARNIEELENEMVKLMAKRAHLGFTTNGHTGEDVFLYAYGPGKPVGLIENTDIPKSIAKFLGFSLTSETFSSWYVDGMKLFKNKGYTVMINKIDPHNPEMVARRGKEELRFPENKNYYLKNNQPILLKSVNVYNGKTFFVHVEE